MSSLERHREAELSIEALRDAAAGWLQEAGRAVPDGRVSAAPDVRAIRFYQRLGLVSKPLRYEGRRAVYGYRHLLELLAIKALQAHGMSLAQVQSALAGASARALEATIELPVAAGALETPVAAAALAQHVSVACAAAAPDAAPGRAAPPGRGGWTAEEVAPGVIALVDRARLADPEHVLDRLRESLK